MPSITVKEAFSPLGVRLWEFESKKYLKQTFWGFGNDNEKYFDFRKLFFELGAAIQGCNSNEIYLEVEFFEKRIIEIIDSLEPKLYHYVEREIDEEGETISRKNVLLDSATQNKVMELWLEELKYYLEQLHKIKQTRIETLQKDNSAPNKKTEVKSAEIKEISLPENFTVSQLNKHFDPQLSLNQAALFLHYLKDQAILPPYSDSSIGKLAEAFFVRNQKNITTSLSNIYSIKESKEELTALKKVIQTLVKQIDKDLKEAH